MIHIGTSGFGFHEWSPSFYPVELCYDRYLEFYAERFEYCELDTSFFSLPSPDAMDALCSRTPDTHRFTVKLFRGLTHERDGDLDVARRFKDALMPMVHRARLGAVLAQFPYSFVNNPHSRAYLCRLRAVLELPLVAELRNDSWLHEESLAFLRGWGIGLAAMDGPDVGGLPNRRAISTTDIGYVRFHGRRADAWWPAGAPGRYDYRYRQRELLSWIPRLREIAKQSKEVFVVFNNHRRGHAVRNAETMVKLVSRARTPRRSASRARAG